MEEGALFPTLSPGFIVLGFFFFFYGGQSDQYEATPRCSFDLNFSNNWQCGASFYVPTSHLCVFFREMSIMVFCPFFSRVVCSLIAEL